MWRFLARSSHRILRCCEESVSSLKLKGDIFAVAFVLAEDYLEPFSDETAGLSSRILLKKEYISQACKAYSQAAEKDPTNSYLHYDVGVSYWQRAQQARCHSEQEEALKFAQSSFKRSIICKPKEAKFWNALAAVHTDPAVQQHLLCRALEIAPSDADTWCNLMAFYVRHGDYQLAQKCHQKVIINDADHPRVWTVYALMKELEWRAAPEGTLKDRKEVALDDFYRFALEYNPKDLFVKQSIPFFSSNRDASLFVLNKSVEQDPSDATAWNLLGLEQERAGHITLAHVSCLRATEILKGEVHEGAAESLCLQNLQLEYIPLLDSALSPGAWKQRNLLLARLNLARVLCKMRLYSSAVSVYEEVIPHLDGGLGKQIPFYALALYRVSRIAESYQILSQFTDPICTEMLCRFRLDNEETAAAYESSLAQYVLHFRRIHKLIMLILVVQKKVSSKVRGGCLARLLFKRRVPMPLNTSATCKLIPIRACVKAC
jgi:tetratricopeptide (TPR) repeat protein